MGTGSEFNSKLLGMICNWCCYGGADLCGVSRLQYPPQIRVMCSARVDLAHIFRAFSNGVDGVFIGGCHINDCHYITNGNYNALGMVKICKKLLEYIGINPERLRLEWVSAGEGIRFANIMRERLRAPLQLRASAEEPEAAHNKFFESDEIKFFVGRFHHTPHIKKKMPATNHTSTCFIIISVLFKLNP